MSDLSPATPTVKRETLATRLGFILLSAGCAIGIGNVWRFPWLAGRYGGACFVLVYLAFLVLLGLPVLTMEFAMGRAARRSPALLYQALGHPGWRWHGALSLVGNVMLMMYYTTVAGWMLSYFVFSARGVFAGLSPEDVGARFGAALASPVTQLVPMALVVVAGFAICAAGLRAGLERVTKWIMLGLLLLMVVLAAHSLLLPGASAGLRYFLVPDPAAVAEHGGWAQLVREAMNQAFFTLSLGIGAMAIFGSYIGRDRALAGEAVRVTILDTIVALCAGLIVIPACFAHGVEPGAGPGLLFVTLPNVFSSMAAGRFWGALFFVFMSFAAFSTVLAVFENILACVRDITGWTRRRAAFVCGIALLILSTPCALGWSLLSNVHPFGGESTFLDAEDFIVSTLLLPVGALIYTLFCCYRFGWGWDAFLAEANAGRGSRLPTFLRPYFAYVLPLVILAIFLLGLHAFFCG
jgi:NSS family neurotransmitter:Na+ symporter